MPTPLHFLPLLCIALSASTTVVQVADMPAVQDQATRAAMPTVTTAQGEASASKARALLHQRWKGAYADTAALARLEELATNTPLIAGNRVTLLYDGPQTMDAMIAVMQAARNHIHLETYIFDPDAVGQRFADTLIAKQRSGVQVRIIYDAVGTLATPSAFFDRMRDAGIQLLEFNPVNPFKLLGPWEPNNRDHRKLLVVDGTVAFTGGVNISNTYSNSSLFRSKSRSKSATKGKPGWRDTHARIEGPAVAALQWEFLGHWAEKSEQGDLADSDLFPPLQPQGNQLVRVLATQPGGEQEIFKSYVLAIGAAKSTVHITCGYFIPDAQIQAALIAAAQRGVDVKLVLPGMQENSLAYFAGHASFRQMLVQGVRIYQLQDSVLHAKTAVIDAMWSTVGSANIDNRSFVHNHELNIVIYDPAVGQEMEQAFAQDVQLSQEVTMAQWDDRSAWDRLREWFAVRWAYWL